MTGEKRHLKGSGIDRNEGRESGYFFGGVRKAGIVSEQIGLFAPGQRGIGGIVGRQTCLIRMPSPKAGIWF